MRGDRRTGTRSRVPTARGAVLLCRWMWPGDYILVKEMQAQRCGIASRKSLQNTAGGHPTCLYFPLASFLLAGRQT